MVCKKRGVIFTWIQVISELLNFSLFWKVDKLCYRHEEEAIDIYVKFCWEGFKSSSSYDNEKVHDYRPYRRWHHLVAEPSFLIQNRY